MQFDPYHRWLGIPKSEQPADFYRLLGLVRFEDDLEVIRDAAERQIAHVRGYAKGEHREAAANILNELARAELTLTDPKRRADYDAYLREEANGKNKSAATDRIAAVDEEAEPDVVPSDAFQRVAEKSNCPKCGVGFRLRAEQIGRTLRCPKCKHQFVGGEQASSLEELNRLPAAETVFESQPDAGDLRLQAPRTDLSSARGQAAQARPATAPRTLVPGKPGQLPGRNPVASAGSNTKQWSAQTKVIVIVAAAAVGLLLLVGGLIVGVVLSGKSPPKEVAAKDSVADQGKASQSNPASMDTTIPAKEEKAGTEPVTPPAVPELQPIPRQTVEEGKLFELPVEFADAAVDRQIYSFSLAEGAPEGMSIDEADGQISWTPTENHGGGKFTIGVIVSHRDDADQQRTVLFAVEVSEVNLPPEFVDAPVSVELKNGVEWKYRLVAMDKDRPVQTLRYKIVNADAFPGISIDEATGEINWVASRIESGAERLDVQVDDGLATVDHQIEISVAAPVLLIAPFSVEEAREAQDRWAKDFKIERVVESPSGIPLVLIPPGEFMMGSKRDDVEMPVHKVQISKAFYLGATEVTQKQWKDVMGSEPWWEEEDYVKEGDAFPATNVSWDDAEDFCKKLSAKEGKKYRLPTEAEWEYTCRAGSTTEYCFGDDEKLLGDYAWFVIRGGNAYAHPVGQKKANAFALHDMHGNIWEWCQDKYDPGYYKNSPLTDPLNLDTGSSRVLRGGSWGDNAMVCRSALRVSLGPSYRHGRSGFRVVCELE